MKRVVAALCVAGLGMACGLSGGPSGSGGGAPGDPGETSMGGQTNDPGDPPGTLSFDGIETARWNRGDGIVATWSMGVGEGDVGYELIVTTIDGAAVETIATDEPTAEVTGLADGEYVLTVTASDAAGAVAGDDVSLTQYVGDNRAVLKSQIDLPGVADVWGKDGIVVVAGRESGLSFVVIDASDPSSPQVLAEVSGEGHVKDVKLGDDLLFISNENGVYATRIFDFSDPSNPVRLSRIKGSVHNIAYADQRMYLTNNVNGKMTVYDVSNPSDPELAWEYTPPASKAHDQAWVDGKLYVAWWEGFSVIDVSQPDDPQTLIEHFYSGPMSDCHNAWPSKDGRYVLTSDEIPGGHLRVWDISDPSDIEQVADHIEEPTAVIHNVHVRGDYAFISHYMVGLLVLDISDPTNPVKIAHYDTTPGSAFDTPNNGQHGTFGVWPFGDVLAVGDRMHGIFFFEFYPIEVTINGPSYLVP